MKKIEIIKERLANLANKKGFNSNFLFEKPYKYSTKESLRWLFLLIEIKMWLSEFHGIDVEVHCERVIRTDKAEGYTVRVMTPKKEIWHWNLGDVHKDYAVALRTGVEAALETLPDIEKK